VFDRYYDDIEVGERRTYGSVTVTEAEVNAFADLTNVHHPIHTDAAYAARSRYGARIAQGLLVLSLGTGLLPTRPETTLGMYGMDDVTFRRPTFLGDTLTARLTVRSKTDKSVGGVVEALLELLDQHSDVVATAGLWMLLASAANAGRTATAVR
jgi:3-hydroxybutyryl-CoA dehydratase